MLKTLFSSLTLCYYLSISAIVMYEDINAVCTLLFLILPNISLLHLHTLVSKKSLRNKSTYFNNSIFLYNQDIDNNFMLYLLSILHYLKYYLNNFFKYFLFLVLFKNYL